MMDVKELTRVIVNVSVVVVALCIVATILTIGSIASAMLLKTMWDTVVASREWAGEADFITLFWACGAFIVMAGLSRWWIIGRETEEEKARLDWKRRHPEQ